MYNWIPFSNLATSPHYFQDDVTSSTSSSVPSPADTADHDYKPPGYLKDVKRPIPTVPDCTKLPSPHPQQPDAQLLSHLRYAHISPQIKGHFFFFSLHINLHILTPIRWCCISPLIVEVNTLFIAYTTYRCRTFSFCYPCQWNQCSPLYLGQAPCHISSLIL